MKHARLGESLWNEWDGSHYEHQIDANSCVLYTEGHIEVHNDVVKRALASAIQRFGIYDSLGQAYSVIDRTNTQTSQGYAGYIDGDRFLSTCDKKGFTYYGEEVQEVFPITWVEIEENDG